MLLFNNSFLEFLSLVSSFQKEILFDHQIKYIGNH